MPLPIAINDLLNGKTVEWARLEFKAAWNPLAVLHTLCAFANDHDNLGGGYIVIGVAEQDGRPVLPPVGLPPGSLDAIQKELLNLGHTAIEPSYHPIVAPYEVDGRHILVLWAPGAQARPYRAKESLAKYERDSSWFIRNGARTVVGRASDQLGLISLADTAPFDERVNKYATVADLDRGLMVAFLEEVRSDLRGPAATLPLVELGRRMHVVAGWSEWTYPLNVGLLFFNSAPHRFFPGTQIDVVWVPEGPGASPLTEKEFRGPIHHILREALDYINRNYVSVTVIGHADRAEADRVSNFPLDAIQEALVNAMYHRAYDERKPVEVRIGRNELSVRSYPGPDRSVKLEALRAGRAMPRRYRNRRIGEMLEELDLTEGRGTGISKIIGAMRENGSPPAVFEFDEHHDYFLVTLPVHPKAARLTVDVVGEGPAVTE
ncbi:MAG: RNA-binding domain-containing protein [Myxococcota bacterium]